MLSRPTRCWIPPGARNGGRGGAPAPLPARSTTPPKGRGTQSHGCGPLACQVLPTGRRLAGGSRGLGPWPGPPPSPAHGTSAEGVRERSHPLHPSGHTHVSPQNPHGAPLSLPGPGRTGGTRVYPPLCGGGWCGVPSKPPRGVPIPPRPRQDRRDSGVSAAVWGWVVWCPLINPHGASLSLPGPGRTGGTRVYPLLCGGGWCGVPS